MWIGGEEHASGLRPTWLEIDLGALERNYVRLRDRVAPRRLWCVVKANSYGHGAPECARRLQEAGADAFAVATVDEGVQLRYAGISGRILVMAGIEPAGTEVARAAACQAVEQQLEVAVWRADAARELGTAALGDDLGPARLHLKVDTGMGRLGVTVGESAVALRLARALNEMDGVVVEGLFSNLAAADAPLDGRGAEHTRRQAERLARLCAALDERGLLPRERHLANSAALLQHDETWQAGWCNGLRPGLALYGVPSFGGEVTIALEPVMSWHSVVADVRRVPEGWPLGYGAERRAERDCEIAVVPVGYHDGFPRALSDRAEVLIGGRRAQVVGAISMDLTLVDVTGLPSVRPGAAVLLLGADAEDSSGGIGAEEIASWAGSISHEILSRVGARVPRRFVESAP